MSGIDVMRRAPQQYKYNASVAFIRLHLLLATEWSKASA